LNLITNQWGIVIFRVMADLPSSVPGQTVTLMSSATRIWIRHRPGWTRSIFERVGTGCVQQDAHGWHFDHHAKWRRMDFNVNGTKLTLMGDASLKRTRMAV